MNNDEFAKRIEEIRERLYKTAYLYLGNQTLAIDAVDEAVYKGLCNHRKLRQPEFFTTWMTRILINECHNEQRRQKRLPKELKDVVILRYFTGYTLAETADALNIPQGTAATRQRKALQLLKLELEEEVF